MHHNSTPLSFFLLVFTSFFFFSFAPSLVSANACVAGGPASSVDAARGCCYHATGKWFQHYPVQAICVMTAAQEATYKGCVRAACGENLNTICIACDEKTDCGLE